MSEIIGTIDMEWRDLRSHLTEEQARDLKWFCQNVRGVQQDFYTINDSVRDFGRRLEQLEKTCQTIEKFLGEKIKPHEAADWNRNQPLEESSE